jgi:hypothetical protein
MAPLGAGPAVQHATVFACFGAVSLGSGRESRRGSHAELFPIAKVGIGKRP